MQAGFVDFLIQSQRVRLGSASPESLDFPERWDWTGLRDAATYHGLALGSFAALSQSDVLSRMPADLVRDWREEYRRLSTFQLAQAVELARIARGLAEAKIPALAYKGPALTLRLFGDLVSRESADLDLLVPKASLFAALEFFETEGYRWAETGPRPHKTSDLSSNHAFTLSSDDRRFLVDLHWHLAEDVALEFVPEISSLFEDPEIVSVLGNPVAAIRPEKLLPVLSFHAVKHAWYLLKWFVDIAALAKLACVSPHLTAEAREEKYRPAEFDWDAAFRYIDSSKSSGVTRVSHLGLLVADRLFECPLPPEVRRRLEKDRRAMALVPVVIDDIRAGRMYDMSEQHRVLLGLNAGAWSRLKTAGVRALRRGWDVLTPSR